MTNHPNRSKQQQAKHTPGPWKVTAHYGDQVYRLWDQDGNYHALRDTVAEMDANARLIAAAPETAAERDRLKALNAELLAVLKTANTVLRNIAAPFGVKNGNEAIGEARLSEIRASLADTNAAIAKAEGR